MRKKLVLCFSRSKKKKKKITHHSNLFHLLMSLAPWVQNIISITSPEHLEWRKDSKDPGTFWTVHFSGILLKTWIVFYQSISHTFQALTNSWPCLVGKYSSYHRETRSSSSSYSYYSFGPKAQTLTCKARCLQGNHSGTSLMHINKQSKKLSWESSLQKVTRVALLPAHAASPQAGPGLYQSDLWVSPGWEKSTASLGNLC